MKLLIVSQTPHYLHNGIVKGWGPTLREIDQLTQLFDEVIHVAPLHQEPAPPSALRYQSPRVHHIAVSPAGGTTLSQKLQIFWHIFGYIRTILRQMQACDVIHVRCPANISLVAIILLAFVKHPQKRWLKYAGNWKPEGREALSYTFQRWWLKKNLANAVVTVNGDWDYSPKHVHGFLNPCLTSHEIEAGTIAAQTKTIGSPLHLLFVGRVEHEKGVGYALQVVSRLKNRGASIHLDIVGDGPERPYFEAVSRELYLDAEITFHGWKSRTELNVFYSRANIILFPSHSEGWPKVLSEAMAFGAVPLASNVSSIPQYLKRFGTGHAFEPDDIDAYFNAILAYIRQPDNWKNESIKSVDAARFFSYDTYVQSVRELLRLG